MTTLDPSLARAIVLKTMFHPQPLRRCQAAIIYAALLGGDFTADEVLCGELTNGDTKISGLAIASLASARLIQCVGRCKSPAASRNGARVNIWRIAISKYNTALTWLERNGLPNPEPRQLELLA